VTLMIAKSQSAGVSICSLSQISSPNSAPKQIALVSVETKLSLCA
jgi:hypothetical protein